jgi:[acyl-carrier-protein] S-malonyltransferase
MRSYAILFPGQGSQKVGMGADLFAAYPDALGRSADAILGWSLEGLLTDGPQELLTRTEHAQPALFAVSFALWRAFGEAVGAPPSAAAGHSLGEYTALAAAGAMSYEEGLTVVSERGRAMGEAASGAEPSTMAALIGADLRLAEDVAANRRSEGGRLWVANINAPGQIVVAGSVDDVRWLTAQGRSLGIRRVVPLDVAGAFHSPYMEPAVARLAQALARVVWQPTRFPVYGNATARPMIDPARELVEQLVSPLRFSETLERMAEGGITDFVHVGPGDVTAGLARRTVRDAVVHVVAGLDDVPAVAHELSVQ